MSKLVKLMKRTTPGVNVQIQQSLGVLSGGDILNIDEGQFVLVVGSTLAFSRAFRLSCSGDVS